VDYKDLNLPRYPKKSAQWYTQYVKDHVSYGSLAEETSSNLRHRPPGKGGKGDKPSKGGDSGEGGGGDNKGPVRPTDDDYTVDPNGGIYIYMYIYICIYIYTYIYKHNICNVYIYIHTYI
jgi:hypothetical protein